MNACATYDQAYASYTMLARETYEIHHNNIDRPEALYKFNATRIVRTTDLNIFSKRISSRNEALNITSNARLWRRQRR